MIRFRVLGFVVAAALISSCSSGDKNIEAKQGKDSRISGSIFSGGGGGNSRASLEIPPDLLATASDKVQANHADSATSVASRVLPEIIGATIHTEGGKSWLSVDADAAVVWRKLTEFWAFEGIALVLQQPESGLMETDWFARSADKNAQRGIVSSVANILSSFIARRTAVDKFNVRLARNAQKTTEVYVTHRGREKIANEFANKNKATEFEWVERKQDAEKVAQLLQAMVLLFDAGGQDSDGQDSGEQDSSEQDSDAQDSDGQDSDAQNSDAPEPT